MIYIFSIFTDHPKLFLGNLDNGLLGFLLRSLGLFDEDLQDTVLEFGGQMLLRFDSIWQSNRSRE